MKQPWNGFGKRIQRFKMEERPANRKDAAPGPKFLNFIGTALVVLLFIVSWLSRCSGLCEITLAFSAGKKLAFFTAPISFASWEARKP